MSLSRWYRHGDLHREDGPAVEQLTGEKEYWLEGKQIAPEDFERMLLLKNAAEVVTAFSGKAKDTPAPRPVRNSRPNEFPDYSPGPASFFLAFAFAATFLRYSAAVSNTCDISTAWRNR